jgi:hypothetical protein
MTLHKYPRWTALRVTRSFLGVLCAICLWTFVSLTAFAQTAIQRDQQALTILAQTITAGGGQDLLTSIQDLTETGTVTYYRDEEVSGNITVKARGLQQFRMDADLPEGRRSTVVNVASGSLTEESGRFRPISGQSVADLWSVTFPYLQIIAAIQDSSTKIIYGGLTTHNGASVYDIRIEKVYTSQQDSTGVRGNREGRDIYIDPNSFLVAAIFDQIHFGGTGDNGVPHEILYTNYQSENGVAMPLTISETVRGVTAATMSLSQVTFNSGLGDSAFSQ